MEPMNPVIAKIVKTMNETAEIAADASIRVLKLGGENAAISTVLQALIATHPDPQHLHRAWQAMLAGAAEAGQQALEGGAEIQTEAHRHTLAFYSRLIDAAAGKR